MKKLIEFKSATLGYGRKTIFEGMDLSIHEGDFIGIVGPNGSGKTTLLRSIMGLLTPAEGEVLRSGDIRFGYCKQRQFVDTVFPFKVHEIVMMARTRLIGPLRRPNRGDREECLKALGMAGIKGLANERFYNLSGGQKQRVLIARALALEPNMLILDEPTTDLDIRAEKEILNLIKRLHVTAGMTIALVSHEFNEFVNLAEKFIFLNGGFSNRVYGLGELSGELLSRIFDTDITLKEVDGKKIVF